MNKHYINVGKYIELYGSDFLYILYNDHIAEYDSIQNKSVRENIERLAFCLEDDVIKLPFGVNVFKRKVTLICIGCHSKGYFNLTWDKDFYEPSEQLNRYRYFERVLPDGTRTKWQEVD